MTSKDYIISQLERLNKSVDTFAINNNNELIDFIYRSLMSKKFRKYSIPEINKTTIREEIKNRVENNEPLIIHYPFGGYKLWRFEESPEPDWAELFAMIYLIRWLKSILDIYEPGIHFVFRFDEVMIERLNNIPVKDTEQYRRIFTEIIEFIKKYSPSNIDFEIFLERSRYENYEAFEQELQIEIENLRKERELNNHKLTESEIAMIDLNVNLKPGQVDDLLWREKNDLEHIAYYILQSKKKHERVHYEHEGIVAFPTYFETPNIIPVGTTKNSIVKFWVGLGALEKRKESFMERVLSFKQYENAEFEFENISIDGLEGKNFKKIRVLE